MSATKLFLGNRSQLSNSTATAVIDRSRNNHDASCSRVARWPIKSHRIAAFDIFFRSKSFKRFQPIDFIVFSIIICLRLLSPAAIAESSILGKTERLVSDALFTDELRWMQSSSSSSPPPLGTFYRRAIVCTQMMPASWPPTSPHRAYTRCRSSLYRNETTASTSVRWVTGAAILLANIRPRTQKSNEQTFLRSEGGGEFMSNE